MKGFQRFVGIDWSGAKGASQPGIQVAEVEIDSRSPRLKAAPNGRHWSRPDVAEYICSLNDKPTLVGIDFAFSIPWDENCVLKSDVNDVSTLWELVDSLCNGVPHMYAGPVWTSADSLFRSYIFHYQTGHRGERYNRNYRRRVEKCEGNAIPVYHMAGPQVGAGSFAGMRLLHHLKKCRGDAIAIWPFDQIDGNRTVIVEIYPSFFYRLAGTSRPTADDLRQSNHAKIDNALHYYCAERAAGDVCRTVDQADALIAATALRKLSNDLAFAIPANSKFDIREGWIFGFPFEADLLTSG